MTMLVIEHGLSQLHHGKMGRASWENGCASWVLENKIKTFHMTRSKILLDAVPLSISKG